MPLLLIVGLFALLFVGESKGAGSGSAAPAPAPKPKSGPLSVHPKLGLKQLPGLPIKRAPETGSTGTDNAVNAPSQTKEEKQAASAINNAKEWLAVGETVYNDARGGSTGPGVPPGDVVT